MPWITVAQQYLVPNPSFEDTLGCPTSPGAVGLNMLELAKGWYKPNSATSDYYNRCAPVYSGVSVPQNWFGYQEAFEGNAYVGLTIYEGFGSQFSEYVQCKLKLFLKPCVQYYVSFYTSLADYSSRATSTLGLRLDTYPIKKQQYAPDEFFAFDLPPHIAPGYTIKDTANWVLVEGIYTAKGGEQYLTIGRFIDTNLYSNSNPPYEINNCDSCWASENFGAPAQYYIDYVKVEEIGIDYNCSLISNIITPNNDGINDKIDISGMDIETVEIYNRWGIKLITLNAGNPIWDGTYNGQPCSAGVYYYIATMQEYHFNGFIQLFR